MRTPHLITRRLTRLVTVGPLTAGLLVTAAVPVLAHGGIIPQPVIDSVPKGLDGLEVEGIVAYAPRIEVTNPDDEVLSIVDDAGRAWLQLSSAGVFADLTVRAWYESLDSTGRGIDPPADAPTGWTHVSTLSSWSWFDTDLLLRATSDGSHAWTIPVAVGGQFDEITGDLEESELQGRWATRLTQSGDIGPSRLTAVSGGVPVFVIQRLEAEQIIVLGPYDEPMLRLTEAGFEANLASPGWIAHARLDPQASIGEVPEDPTGEPVWQMRLEDAPTATWLDLRGTTLEVVPSKRSDSELDFTIPIIVDGTRYDVGAVTQWQGDQVPLLGIRMSVPTLIAVSLGAGLLAAGVVQQLESRRARRGKVASIDDGDTDQGANDDDESEA